MNIGINILILDDQWDKCVDIIMNNHIEMNTGINILILDDQWSKNVDIIMNNDIEGNFIQ